MRVQASDVLLQRVHQLVRQISTRPDIPIQVTAIDYAALAGREALAPEEALKAVAAALQSAGLTPEHATPVVGHTVFKTVSTASDNRAPASTTTNLDTHVHYRFTLDGHLMVGPGAQVQVSLDPEGKATRLLHSVRTLKRGPSVAILPVERVRGRFAKFLPDDAEVDVRLVYWAPPLRPGVHSSSQSTTSAIIPWYAVTIRRRFFDPSTKRMQTRTSRVHLVPATDDFRYVPSVSLKVATPEASLVEARAKASGGTPPYTYLWAGSNPEASSSRSDAVRYVPLVRDFRSVLRTQSLERTDNVSVTVFDANGVTVQAGQPVQVTARPAPRSHNSVTYGCESPNDPGPSPTDGSYAPERIAWRTGPGRRPARRHDLGTRWQACEFGRGGLSARSPRSYPASTWIDDAFDEEDRDESIGKWRRVFGDDFASQVVIAKAGRVTEDAQASEGRRTTNSRAGSA